MAVSSLRRVLVSLVVPSAAFAITLLLLLMPVHDEYNEQKYPTAPVYRESIAGNLLDRKIDIVVVLAAAVFAVLAALLTYRLGRRLLREKAHDDF